jgi:hypothetical protein
VGMNPSTFITGSAPLTGFDPAMAGYAPDGPLRVRVRANEAPLIISYERLALRNVAADAPVSDAFLMPTDTVEDFILSQGQRLYVANDTAVGVKYSAACSDYWASVPREQEPNVAAVRRKVLTLGSPPIMIAKAVADRPCRLTIRNVSARGNTAGISEEIQNLIDAPGRGYQIPGLEKDVFYLAPGQRLYAVASGAGTTVLSVEESDVVTYQGPVLF